MKTDIMKENDEGEDEGLKAIREHEDCTDDYYSDWLSDNKNELMKEFFKENREGFPSYATSRDVEEYYPDEFLEYVKEVFREDCFRLL